ncbi:uncharacterized protein [Diadema setosum]|uniref:uncharacterized protein n=1 Tax=Diadema setosum TaxID=31175 RepID=UPI003B3ADF57
MATDFKALKKEFIETPEDLQKHLPKVLECIKADPGGKDSFEDVCLWEVERKLFSKVKEAKNKHEALMVEICIESMKKKTKSYYKLVEDILREKFYVKWKGHEDAIKKMIEILKEPIEWVPKNDKEWEERKKHLSWSDFGGALQSAVDYSVRACSRDKIVKKVNAAYAELVTSCLKSASPMHVIVALTVIEASDMSWEGCEKLVPNILDAYDQWMRRDDVDFGENRDHQRLADYATNHNLLGVAGKACVKSLVSIAEYCMEQELEGDETDLSTHGTMLRNIIYHFMMKNYDTPKLISDLIPYAVKLLTCDVTELESAAGYIIGTLYQKGELLAPHGEAIVEACLNKKCEGSNLGMALKGIFQYNPDVILSHIDGLVQLLEDMPTSDKTYLYMLFGDVAKKNPEALEAHVDVLMEDVTDATLAAVCFMAVADISIPYPKRFEKHVDKCISAWEQIPYTVASACKTIASVGRISKQHADKSLKILFGKLETIDPMWISVIIMEAKRVGQAYKESMEPYRSQLEELKKCQQMGVPDLVQSVLDFLDDRSLKGLSEDIAEQREDIDNLDSRVTTTENDVKRLDETVEQQGDDIKNVKNEVHEQGEKLEELKEVVDETVEKVEEIDHKTITNAPKWSRDVSKLLNPEHEHDWRFLAVRLGYSGEDIRNWALSPDPTMAILAEWYTTHKSSDATYAILSALEDMGRTDAAEIITQSLEEAELLVPQAPSDDSEKPPAIFLSYQWDHQPEVKAIRKHLEMAGFPCWMDIGQMGGGDQLFARISQGMRSAKVVLCMVTEKYSGSENCNKEVNLANLLNKPIIPILIDRTPWPPEGAMSMLFAQLLYIQFYNEKEYVRGEKFWDDAKFSELLGQISYHANPDESMVTEEYRNWIPQVEDKPAVVKKVEETSSNAQSKSNTQEPLEHPSVFISYQWGKQPEIKKLFSRLTSLGYHCWLDINQMGGGDPLYSKIDKGIRNAKVVVSCVTPKYALSANCRREVSLSDALRKPVVPLLMEQMTWPPEGPMSMTFTQLLYIDFTKETSQANFDDEKFDELLLKIQEHAQPTLQLVEAADQSPDQEKEEEEASQEEQPDEGEKTQEENTPDEKEEPERQSPTDKEVPERPSSTEQKESERPPSAEQKQPETPTSTGQEVPERQDSPTPVAEADPPPPPPPPPQVTEVQPKPQEAQIGGPTDNSQAPENKGRAGSGKKNKKSSLCVII